MEGRTGDPLGLEGRSHTGDPLGLEGRIHGLQPRSPLRWRAAGVTQPQLQPRARERSHPPGSEPQPRTERSHAGVGATGGLSPIHARGSAAMPAVAAAAAAASIVEP